MPVIYVTLCERFFEKSGKKKKKKRKKEKSYGVFVHRFLQCFILFRDSEIFKIVYNYPTPATKFNNLFLYREVIFI